MSAPQYFNSYGARRGNDLVMARGTFANIRLKNHAGCAEGRQLDKASHLRRSDVHL